MPTGVIFDVDGTLVDSNVYHARAWIDALKAFGHIISLSEMRRQIGKGADQLLPVFLSAKQMAADAKEITELRSALFKRHYLPLVEPFAAVRSLFERLTAEGKKIALASPAKKDELAAYKRIANIEDLVPAETSADDADRSKPEPDIFEAALRRLGCASGDALVVGDTPYDAEAAGKAGIPVIGVTCGGWAANDLTRAGCLAVYKSVAHLLAQYDESLLNR